MSTCTISNTSLSKCEREDDAIEHSHRLIRAIPWFVPCERAGVFYSSSSCYCFLPGCMPNLLLYLCALAQKSVVKWVRAGDFWPSELITNVGGRGFESRLGRWISTSDNYVVPIFWPVVGFVFSGYSECSPPSASRTSIHLHFPIAHSYNYTKINALL